MSPGSEDLRPGDSEPRHGRRSHRRPTDRWQEGRPARVVESAAARGPDGEDGLGELSSAGASFIRTGRGDWSAGRLDAQLASERAELDAAAVHGLLCWLYLGDIPDLPPRTAGQQASAREQMLSTIAASLKDHPGLGAYKGVDEPRNPFRGTNWIRPEGLVRAARRLKAIDPDHPLVIIQAPRSTVAQLTPYRPAFDITGADIFPIAYPPGEHSDLANRDISVVGDVTRKMVRAAGGKPVWTTLQIAWSGTAPSATKPNVVPRFPTLHELRFMAYQAIACGARGLMFFGGHLTQTARPVDARAGWNWTFWDIVLARVTVQRRSERARRYRVLEKREAVACLGAVDQEANPMLPRKTSSLSVGPTSFTPPARPSIPTPLLGHSGRKNDHDVCAIQVWCDKAFIDAWTHAGCAEARDRFLTDHADAQIAELYARQVLEGAIEVELPAVYIAELRRIDAPQS